MKNIFLGLAFSIAIFFHSALAMAEVKERVRVRSDGNIVDIKGNIIAVPNTSDSRNDPYQRYYSKVGKDGAANKESDFYIISDTNAGYVKKDINPPPAKDVVKESPAMKMIPEVKGGKTVPKQPEKNDDKSKLQLDKEDNRGIYDNLGGGGGVYE